ncbi:hypothetical protein FR483_n581R [Paramecium bursaria Chlorella virus FR483]|uniref:Uncharacterized protein n581R n=1 Tax=Paramecium bursaria Chlorella virus FR483 TaxID=399781 RepID=A7J7T5_PBCVF|nr:hypothetical protein FR483_n581R [Paramecium bursaria Chlorella virus FR483]ABT15866.1 hypothetical protein FR483_n581R [Paramecium bursaria Chlorella virus FR483]
MFFWIFFTILASDIWRAIAILAMRVSILARASFTAASCFFCSITLRSTAFSAIAACSLACSRCFFCILSLSRVLMIPVWPVVFAFI